MELKEFVKDFRKEDYDFFVICGDVGGTYTRLAVAGIRNGIKLIFEVDIETRRMKKFHDFMNNTLKYAHERFGIEISRACFAVAGPVSGRKARLTNAPLTINADEVLKNSLLASVDLINDFEALGYALDNLGEKDVIRLSKAAEGKGVKILIGPGTGLGKAIIVSNNVLASEGGNALFPPINEFELELANYARKKLKSKEPLGYEELVSGPGIARTYSFLRFIREFPETKYTKKIDKARNKEELISKYTAADRTCQKTMELFVRFLARCASNLALDTLSYGGVYIAGGIAPKNIDLFKQHFMPEFIKNYRMSRLLKKMPVFVIMNPETSLVGAANAAIQNI